MPTRVYQFGLLPPVEGEELARAQLRAAHEYRNELVAIERGRRAALRAVDDASEAVLEAKAIVRVSTKHARKQAVQALRRARIEARAAAAAELALISERDESIRRDARALCKCYWGTYLGIEAAHQQSRSQPLYGSDAVTPNDPAFQRGPRWRDSFRPGDPRREWWLATGQVGVQLQKGATTAEMLGGEDSRVRLELGPPQKRGRRYGFLWLRVGSRGRDPVWAKWPIKTHREVPSEAVWKWVRVSVCPDGLRERWTVEITADAPEVPRARGVGAVAVEWEWSPLDDGGIRVARWCANGERGEIELPARVVSGIKKPSGIRAVRDMILNDAREKIQRAVKEDREAPEFARREAQTMHLWKSAQRFRALAMRWRLLERKSSSFALLDAWERRDAHLYEYEAGVRGEALRERREFYRVLAARWRARFGVALLSDQDLSREARWGDDSDVRFVAGASELRAALRHAFGCDAIDSRWRDRPDESDEREWCERTADAWKAGGARGDGRFAAEKVKSGNAWAARRAKKGGKQVESGVAREAVGKSAEELGA